MQTDLGSEHPVYLVDDDKVVRESIDFLLSTVGLNCRMFENGASFVAEVADLPDGCLLLDLMMPQVDGLDVMRHLVATGRRMPIILMTATTNVSIMRLATSISPHVLLEKPFDEEDLFAAIKDGFDVLDRGRSEIDAEAARAVVAELSHDQITILRGLIADIDTPALARRLGVSEVSMRRDHLSLRERIGARDVHHSIAIGLLAGLLPLEP